MKILICLAAFALASCGAAEPVHLTIATPPADKLACLDEPGRPVGTGDSYVDDKGVTRNRVTDLEAGRYMVGLRNAGQSCRDDVEWLRDWFANLK